MYRLTLLLSLWLTSTALSANVDSLTTVYEASNDYKEKITILENLAYHFIYDDPDSSYFYAQTYKDLAESTQDHDNVALAHVLLGNVHLIKNELPKGLDVLGDGLKYCDQNKVLPLTQSKLKVTKATFFLHQDNLVEAGKLFNAALNEFDESTPKQFLMTTLLNRSAILVNTSDYGSAVEDLLECERLIEEYDLQRKGYLSNVYANLGSCYGYMDLFEKALVYGQKAIALAEELDDKVALRASLNNMGGWLRSMDRTEEGISFYQRSLDLSSGTKSRSDGFSHFGLSQCYEELEAYDKALVHSEESLLINLRNEAFSHAVLDSANNAYFRYELKNGGTDFNAYHERAYDALVKEGNLELANNLLFIWLNRRLRTKGMSKDISLVNRYDSLLKNSFRDDVRLKTSNLEVKYETEKKEAENQLLKQEAELKEGQLARQRYILMGAAIGLALLGLIIYLISRQAKVRKQSNKALAVKNTQIEQLNQELSHRVKNNLALVSSLMKMQSRRLDSEEAKAALKEGQSRIQAMASLHRRLHEQKGTQLDLDDYLREVCDYLLEINPDLDQSLQIALECETITIDGEDAARIGLIVNELVTNSFKHAFGDETTPKITIHVRETKDDKLLLSYRDNGPGMPIDFDLRSTSSLGLKLIHILTEQMNGKVMQRNDQGFVMELEFDKSAA